MNSKDELCESQAIMAQQRSKLIQDYSPLVKVVAYRIANRLPPNVELDDLISAGIVGLIDAVDKFDQRKSQNFKKYAEIRIRGAILDELRMLDLYSREARRKDKELRHVSLDLQKKLGRPASAEEVASALGIELERYFDLISQLKPTMRVSFEENVDGNTTEKQISLKKLRDSQIPDPMVVAHLKILWKRLTHLIELLPEKQRQVITLYYFEDLNLKEIGDVLAVSESRVSQIHTQAISSLKRKLNRTRITRNF